MIYHVLSSGAALIRRIGLRPPARIDVVVTGMILLLNTGGYLLPGVLPFGPWRFLVETATIVPLLYRETYPVPSTITTGVLTLIVTATVHPAQPFPYAVLVSEYTIGSLLRGWIRVFMITTYMAGNVLAEYLHKQMSHPEDFFVTFALGVTAIFLGLLLQSERDSVSVLAERAASAERARIARDMHDVVGHAVALMVVQAEAGPLYVRSKPERAEAAFDAISAAGRDAMAQLRGLLGVLQQDGAGHRDPVPSLAGLDDLVEQVRAAGLHVDVSATGTPATLSPGAETVAYRVVQEALTNTLKHARASRADVRLTWSAQALEITVADNGRGAALGGWADGSGSVSSGASAGSGSVGASGGSGSGGARGGSGSGRARGGSVSASGGNGSGGSSGGPGHSLGHGLSPSPGSGGHGLAGLRERLAPVGGRLSWHSPPDVGGFALTAYIPSDK